MQFFWQDLRYGFRSLLRNLGFTAVAILLLALGICPNSAIFTVVNAVLLKPLPMPEPDHVMMIWQTLLRSGFDQLPATGADYWTGSSNPTRSRTCPRRLLFPNMG